MNISSAFTEKLGCKFMSISRNVYLFYIRVLKSNLRKDMEIREGRLNNRWQLVVIFFVSIKQILHLIINLHSFTTSIQPIQRAPKSLRRWFIGV